MDSSWAPALEADLWLIPTLIHTCALCATHAQINYFKDYFSNQSHPWHWTTTSLSQALLNQIQNLHSSFPHCMLSKLSSLKTSWPSVATGLGAFSGQLESFGARVGGWISRDGVSFLAIGKDLIPLTRCCCCWHVTSHLPPGFCSSKAPEFSSTSEKGWHPLALMNCMVFTPKMWQVPLDALGCSSLGKNSGWRFWSKGYH